MLTCPSFFFTFDVVEMYLNGVEKLLYAGHLEGASGVLICSGRISGRLIWIPLRT